MEDVAETLRIRIQIGENRFDGEGSPTAIQAQMRNFMRLMGHDAPAVNMEERTENASGAPVVPDPPQLDIRELLRIDGNVVALSAKSESLERDVLVLLLGQQQFRNNNAIGGTEIMAGMRASGHQVSRADYILNRYIRMGDIVVTGKRRRRRYRLTTDGIAKAGEFVLARRQ